MFISKDQKSICFSTMIRQDVNYQETFFFWIILRFKFRFRFLMVVLKEYNMIHDKNTIKNIHMIGCDIIGLEHRNMVKFTLSSEATATSKRCIVPELSTPHILNLLCLIAYYWRFFHAKFQHSRSSSLASTLFWSKEPFIG